MLGMLFWAAGTAIARATGAILILALASVFVMLFYTAPVIFLLIGSTPAIAALTILGMSDGRTWRELLPIWFVLGMSTLFSLARALEMPSAQINQRRLDDNRHKFEILAENVHDVICRTDLKGVREYISPSCFAMLGYQPEELIGASRWDNHHPDNDTVGIVAAFNRMMADPSRSETMTVRVRHKDGHWLWLQSKAKLVCADGVPVGVIDVSRDVTEQVAIDLALREAKAEAEAANRVKAEFLPNVSHEIRTPMNGILGALRLLDTEAISPEGRELMRQAEECGLMLSQLLNDVLDFSKIEAGQLDLAPEAMDVGEALEGVCLLLRGQALAKGIDLRREIKGADLWIEADSVRVRQSMFNLIGNAVKFTASGHVIARLSVEPLPAGRRRTTLEIEDTGIGMSPEALAHLFERFRQADGDTARRFGGAGLGLSITQALAELMVGSIGVVSVEGQGSTFRMTFDAPSARPVLVAAVEPGLLHGVRVLLVEDNATNRLVARTMLGRLGAVVDEAEDGIAGLAAARKGPYDLILMDVQMPRMDGVDCARAIRELGGPAGRTPILALTANVMVHQTAAYMAAGMNGVVGKPIMPADLIQAISRVIGEGQIGPQACVVAA